MDKLGIVFALAVIIEAIVNIFYPPDSPPSKWKLPISLTLGIAITVIWQVGVLAALDIAIPSEVARYTDYVLTGVLVSRGANYLHTLVVALQATYTPKL